MFHRFFKFFDKVYVLDFLFAFFDFQSAVHIDYDDYYLADSLFKNF